MTSETYWWGWYDERVSRSSIRGGTGDRLSRAECDIIL